MARAGVLKQYWSPAMIQAVIGTQRSPDALREEHGEMTERLCYWSEIGTKILTRASDEGKVGVSVYLTASDPVLRQAGRAVVTACCVADLGAVPTRTRGAILSRMTGLSDWLNTSVIDVIGLLATQTERSGSSAG